MTKQANKKSMEYTLVKNPPMGLVFVMNMCYIVNKQTNKHSQKQKSPSQGQHAGGEGGWHTLEDHLLFVDYNSYTFIITTQ